MAFALVRPVDDLLLEVLVFAAGRFAEDRVLTAFFVVRAFADLLAGLRRLVLLVAVLLRLGLAAPDFDAADLRIGSFLRLVAASSSSCFSLIDSAMLLEAPRSEDFDCSPRFADKAAPAAICCFFDFAGISE